MRKTIHRMQAAPRSRSRGVTLIELLVAVAIGLIATVAIFQVFAVFEGQKRTTASGGEAQTNGALALFTLERELRLAGYGINNTDYLGCNILGWHEATGGTAFTLTWAPVRITQGVAGAPDTVTVMYGSGNLLPNPANITQNMASPVVPYVVGNRYGFREGDVIIAAETGKDCTLAQVSNLPTGAGQTGQILHASGSYNDPDTGAPTATRYNKPAGLGVSYTFNGKVFNIGARPVNNIYTIQSGQLMLAQMLSAPTTAAAALYDGIVQVQAQYGKDDGIDNGTVVHASYTAGDGIIDKFDEVPPVTAADWAQVLAVRIAVVARSNLPERPDPDGVCRTTTAASANRPQWAAGDIDVSADANWQCYRYKTFETTVPIRNMFWRP